MDQSSAGTIIFSMDSGDDSRESNSGYEVRAGIDWPLAGMAPGKAPDGGKAPGKTPGKPGVAPGKPGVAPGLPPIIEFMRLESMFSSAPSTFWEAGNSQ